MTTLTLATVAVIIFGVVGRHGYGLALALGGATAAGAAVVVGTVAVPTFYAVAIGAAVAIALRLLQQGAGASRSRLTLPPGAALLLLFLGWSVLVTLVAPQLFDGQAVLLPTGIDAHLTAGTLTSSNFAQIIYLVLGVSVVVFLARSPSARPGLIGLALSVTVLLSFWRYLHVEGGVPFPEDVFDNTPFFAYIETAPGGVQRFRGILTEPSSLAGSCLVAVSYLVARAPQTQGARRWGCWVVAVIAAYLGTISTSASFVVAAVVLVFVAALAFGVSFLSQRTSVSTTVSLLGCALVVAALWALPVATDFVQSVVDEKVGSSSYNDRSGADTASYRILVDTYGFGVGLGSSRGSSFVAGLLSTTGIVGTLLLTAVVVTLIRRSVAVVEYRPVIWALVTLLILKFIAGPDLNDTSGVLWMSLGLLSRAVWLAETAGSAVPSRTPSPAFLSPSSGRVPAPNPTGPRPLTIADRGPDT